MVGVGASSSSSSLPDPSVMLIGLLRCGLVMKKYQNCILNDAGLYTAWISAAGLIMVGNFQVISL